MDPPSPSRGRGLDPSSASGSVLAKRGLVAGLSFSQTNPFEIARFRGMYAWRQGKNGISFGSVAGMQIIDAVVVDNNMRGVEGTGADGTREGLDSMTKLRGPWGSNKLINTLFVGHHLSCPNCDQAFVPNFPAGVADGKLSPRGFWVPDAISNGYPGATVRIGFETACWLGLTVENATFINYDRQGMVAVGGFAKAIPPGYLYDFWDAGGMETRFSGTKWFQTTKRVRWRWNNELLLVDLDGSFCDRPSWSAVGCQVVRNDLVLQNAHSFPDCYMDGRYDGSVCKSSTTHLVKAGFMPADPLMTIVKLRMSYRDSNGMFVRCVCLERNSARTPALTTVKGATH